jgi:hypothetical protein
MAIKSKNKNVPLHRPRPTDRQWILARIEGLLADGEASTLKLVEEKRGFDPYNSGSFDRSKGWTKINRR